MSRMNLSGHVGHVTIKGGPKSKPLPNDRKLY